MDEITLDNILTTATVTLLVGLVVILVLTMCFVITESLSIPNYTGDCLERGYTDYQSVKQDGEYIFYCTRLRNGYEEVYRLIPEEE